MIIFVLQLDNDFSIVQITFASDQLRQMCLWQFLASDELAQMRNTVKTSALRQICLSQFLHRMNLLR